MQSIALRQATPADLDLLLYWDTKQHVIDADPDDEWNWVLELQRTPEWREQLIAELDGIPLGMIQIIDPELEGSHYWGAVAPNQRAIDIWIGEEEHLGKGYGTTMMQLAIERCFQDPAVKNILIDPLKSNVRAHKFYEKLGFQFVEERFFEGTACYVYELRRAGVTVDFYYKKED